MCVCMCVCVSATQLHAECHTDCIVSARQAVLVLPVRLSMLWTREGTRVCLYSFTALADPVHVSMSHTGGYFKGTVHHEQGYLRMCMHVCAYVSQRCTYKALRYSIANASM